jgi:hypothetical protein
MQSSTKAPRHLYTNVAQELGFIARGGQEERTLTRKEDEEDDEDDDEDDDEEPTKWTWQTAIHPRTKGLMPIHGFSNRASNAFFPSFFSQIWLQDRHTRKIEKFRNCAIFC